MTEVKPGLYLSGAVDYATIQAVNFSSLKEILTSPRRYRHRLKSPRPSTKNMRLGTAAHTAVLEPERFMIDYALFSGKRRAGKKWKEFQAANDGKQIIKTDEYKTAIAIRDAVRRDACAMRYLEAGHPEVTIVWDDTETGVRCKGRLDWVSQDPSDVVVDLKGAANIESFAFWRSAARLLYHAQKAFYLDGFKAAVPGSDPKSKVVAVEFEEPHDVVVYNMTNEVLDKGREEYRSMLIRLVECEHRREWPGYANGCEMDAQLPAWMMTEDDDLESLGLELPGAAE